MNVERQILKYNVIIQLLTALIFNSAIELPYSEIALPFFISSQYITFGTHVDPYQTLFRF
jgi:hypothetical protein